MPCDAPYQLLPAAAALNVSDSASVIGGGSCPETALPSAALALALPGGALPSLEAFLRAYTPPIITRSADDRVWIDLRTVLPEQEPVLVEAFRAWAHER